MPRISPSAAWESTINFFKANARLVVPVALAFLALPAIVTQPWLGDGSAIRSPSASGGLPEFTPGSIAAFILVSLLGMLGSLAINALVLRPGVSVAEALKIAAARFLPAFGANLLTGVISALLCMPFLILYGILVQAGQPAAAALVMILFIPLFLYVLVRLLLSNAVVIAEDANPVLALKRSWALTAASALKLVAMLILVILALGILFLAATLAGGSLLLLLGKLLGSEALGLFLARALSSLVSAVLSAIVVILLAYCYRQAAGGQAAASTA